MVASTENSDARSQAEERAEKKLDFYKHAGVYVVVNGILAAVDLSTSPDKLWFFWPLGGWGIGLLLHGFSVFGSTNLSSVKERMVEQELERERRAEEAARGESAEDD